MCLAQSYMSDKQAQAKHYWSYFIRITPANEQLPVMYILNRLQEDVMGSVFFFYRIAVVFVRSWKDELGFLGKRCGLEKPMGLQADSSSSLGKCVWRRGAAKERDIHTHTHTHTMKGRGGYKKRLCNPSWAKGEIDDVLLSHAFCGELREEKI